jgi:hypothetical protein
MGEKGISQYLSRPASGLKVSSTSHNRALSLKDRATMLREQLKPVLTGHIKGVNLHHEPDLEMAMGEVFLPFALEKKWQRQAKNGPETA